jgi:hypothetical protein
VLNVEAALRAVQRLAAEHGIKLEDDDEDNVVSIATRSQN